MQQPFSRRFAPALVAFAFFVVMALLWIAHVVPVYRKIVVLWGIDVFDFPFLDTETVLSGARCLRAGVDVYVSNPCDTLGRVYDYSPLWMVIAALPVTIAWGMPIGILVALLYFGALALLPPGRTARHQLAITLGAVSSVAMFAVERGNNDLVLFALAAAAATLALRSPAVRLIGYGCALLAGLLKYYPMLLLALAARERLPRLLAIAAGALLLTALFVIIAWHDLTRALGLIPTGSYFGGAFGAVQLPGGLCSLLGLPRSVVPVLRWTMTLAALGIGALLALRESTGAALAELTPRERAFLLVGGLLVLGSFFTAQNIGYRAIHLLLAVPALLGLRATGSRLFYPAPTIALALLWNNAWRKGLLYAGKPWGISIHNLANLIGWDIHEMLWWWLVTLLAAGIFGLLWRSTLLGRRPALWLD